MGNNLKKESVGLITFHSSYNCGSMLQTYALQTCIEQTGNKCEVIDFSNAGQKELYNIFARNNSIKNILKNIILWPHKKCIKQNYDSYEQFKKNNFKLSADTFEDMCQLSDDGYKTIVAGSDQVWNITIEDGDDAYFLPWAAKSKKVAYAPSFGSKNIQKYASDVDKYRNFLLDFDFLSIRENNGKKWIKELIGKDVPVLLDPTLLLNAVDYDKIASKKLSLPDRYVFYYSPGYSQEINKVVKAVSKKYNLPVLAFNAKTFYVKAMQTWGFALPAIENPAIYLQLIKNATLIFTTSFHGTVFSSIYRKTFWTIKNGGMYGDDDRVWTLMEQLGLENQLIETPFDEKFDYLQEPNYQRYNGKLLPLQEKARTYLTAALQDEVKHQ